MHASERSRERRRGGETRPSKIETETKSKKTTSRASWVGWARPDGQERFAVVVDERGVYAGRIEADELGSRERGGRGEEAGTVEGLTFAAYQCI